jgi:hypothetical protein
MRFWKMFLAIFLFLACVYTTPIIKGDLSFAYGFGFFIIYFLMGAAITLNKSAKKIPLKLFGLKKTEGVEDNKKVSFLKSISTIDDFISACFYANVIQLGLELLELFSFLSRTSK